MQEELFNAIYIDDENKVKEILTYHVSDELLNKFGSPPNHDYLFSLTPLMYTAYLNKYKYSLLLIDAGSNLNISNHYGYMFHYVINFNKLSNKSNLIKKMIENGADINLLSEYYIEKLNLCLC